MPMPAPRRTAGPQGASGDVRGFSLIELLVCVAIILIIAAIAIPNYLRSRMMANQAAAAENLRTITTAAVVYNTTWGNGYPPTLATLGGPGPATCDTAVLLDNVIASPPSQKSGYTFAYIPEGANVLKPPSCGSPGFTAYLVTANPLTILTGRSSFCSNEPGVIHVDYNGGAIGTPLACDALPNL
jgi:type IV pilus assembly protein PilA